MSTPEGRVKDKLKRRLTDKFGKQCWRFMPVQTGYGSQALDFILCFRGWFVTVETKTPDGEYSPTQRNTRRETLEAGGLVFCVYDDETLDFFINYISELEFLHGRYDDGQDPIPLYAKDARERRQHLRAQQQGETVAGSTRRDHGASRTASRRRAQSGASGQDQAVTVAVTCTCVATKDEISGAPLIVPCPACRLKWM